MSRRDGGMSLGVVPAVSSHAPSRHDALVAKLSEVVGGPAGRRRRYPQPAFGASFVWGAGPVLVLVAMATMVLTQLINQPCRSRGWASPTQFTHLCYSDVPSAVGGSHSPQSAGNWLLTSFVGWLAPQGTTHLRTAVDIMTVLTAVALAVLVVAVVRLAGHRPWDAGLVAASPVVVVTGLVSTDLLAVALVFWALTLMFTRSPRRTPRGTRVARADAASLSVPRLLTSGMLIGLAATIRPVAVIALLALLACALRARRVERVGPVAVGTLMGFAVPNAVQFVSSPQGWWDYPKSLLNADLGYGSVMVIPRLLSQGIPEGQRDLSPPVWVAFVGLGVLVAVIGVRAVMPRTVQQEWLPLDDRALQAACALIVLAPLIVTFAGPSVLRSFTTSPPGAFAGRVFWGVGTVLVLAGVAFLLITAPRRPRLAVVMLLLTMGLSAVAPSVPVQTGLWLVPLLALALPSWRLVLAWSVAECLYAGATWLYIYGLSEANRGLPVGWFVMFVMIRLAAWVGVAVAAVRLTRHPQFDPVRNRPDPALVWASQQETGGPRDWFRDDPAAGLLDTGSSALPPPRSSDRR